MEANRDQQRTPRPPSDDKSWWEVPVEASAAFVKVSNNLMKAIINLLFACALLSGVFKFEDAKAWLEQMATKTGKQGSPVVDKPHPSNQNQAPLRGGIDQRYQQERIEQQPTVLQVNISPSASTSSSTGDLDSKKDTAVVNLQSRLKAMDQGPDVLILDMNGKKGYFNKEKQTKDTLMYKYIPPVDDSSSVERFNPALISTRRQVSSIILKVRAVHQVRPGHILGKVAEMYGISKEALMKANMRSVDNATRGEWLLIPFSKDGTLSFEVEKN